MEKQPEREESYVETNKEKDHVDTNEGAISSVSEEKSAKSTNSIEDDIKDLTGNLKFWFEYLICF